MGFSVSEAQLRRMVDLVQPSTEQPVPGECFDHGLMSRLRSAFDCFDVSFMVSDPSHEQFVSLTEAEEDGVRVTVEDVFADEEASRADWAVHSADLFCCYPQMTGDYISVTTSRDFYETDRELAGSPAWVHEEDNRLESLGVPLPLSHGLDRRLLFWRIPGQRFGEGERLVLTLLRPHLARVLESHDRAAMCAPRLTPREREILALLSRGFTNRQIGRELGIAEGTVRKHLEHVYARLGVTNRVSALAVYPDLLNEARSAGGRNFATL